VWQGDAFVPIRVEKRLAISAGSRQLPVSYTITNTSQQKISARFGVEFCFGLLAGHSDDAFYRAAGIGKAERWLDSRGEIEAEHIALVNEFLGIEIALGLRTLSRLWRMPVETISLSEAGFERVYQASCVLPLWDIHLKPGESWQTSLQFQLNAL
jgi:alpha-amylase